MKAIANLLGYQISAQLYAGTRTLVYRAIRTDDQQPVVIKLLRNEYPNFNEIVQFRNQYTIAKNLNFPSVIQPLTLEAYRNSYALVMEDFGGVSLSVYVKAAIDESQIYQSLPLAEFLNIAIQLTDILHYLYQNRVIHKDIKPANILINPDTKQIKLIDFSISSLLPRETQEIQNPNILEGTLAYLSPEQTGRMNRGIDYRSDFYSLGVTFYELLTGELPFVSADAMELVHCHLAKQPIPIHQINPEIPLALSEIVSKLMAKNAENRYQTALGIKHDLEICLEQLQTTGKLESFKLGERDISDRFTIPEKLYGRENEVTQLLAAFERVSTGNTEMMLVAGFSGIGKTAVVNEVHKPIVRQRGYFIKGKYDQFNRNIPFSAFVQAFRDLMGQLLSESDEQLQSWKNQILVAVGDNGQILIDVIPELENIIGKQPPATELSGNAAQNRFNLLFQKFVKIFTSKEHPLVIFLDDLQWADSASLNLLKLLLQDTGYLLALGAYRDNEVSPVHPFILTVDEMVKAGATVNTITLPPLRELDLNKLVADTLNCELSLAQPLTKLVYQKTQGNPFFATQFLKALHDDKLISFDWDIRHWQCDLAQVKALAITDDVVEFMALQLQKLPTRTQDILKLAACIGAEFDLNTLVIVSEQSAGATATALWKALQEGLVIPTTRIYKFFAQSDSEEVLPASANPTYRFLHDRVQQAAYSLIPEEQKQVTHLKIGQLLLSHTTATEQEEKLFEIVNQLNLGKNLIIDRLERTELTKLNLKAGQKAKIATAYAAAVEYLTVGIALLCEDAWKSDYDLILALHVEVTEAAYLNADFEQMERWATIVLQHAKTLLETVKIYETQLLAAQTQGQLKDALHIGLQVLKSFGVDFPEEPTGADIGAAFGVTQTLLAGRDPLSLLDLPTMIEPDRLAAIQMMTLLIPPAYLAAPTLMPLLIFKQVELSLQYGNCSLSPFSYGDYGVMLCGVMGDLNGGYKFGQLAFAVLERFQATPCKSRSGYVVNFFLSHWKTPLQDLLHPLQEAYESGLTNGDPEFVGMNAHGYCYYSYFAGKELTALALEMAAYHEIVSKLKRELTLNWLKIAQQTVLNLLGRSEISWQLTGSVYSAEQMLPVLEANRDRAGLFHFHFNQTVLYYLFGQYLQAFQQSALVEPYLDGSLATFPLVLYSFYDALVHLALYGEVTEEEKQQILDRVETHQQKMQGWADLAPFNHQHRWELVEAERYAVLGDRKTAMDFYDRACALAKENGFLQDEALAKELTAKFYLDWGKEKFAAIYMQEAYYCYVRWGAKAKVMDLEKCYPQLLAPILQQPRATDSCKETILQGTIASSKTSSSSFEMLDLATLLKASQAISGEIELNQLLTTLLKIVIANAGASKCVLLLKQDINLQVVALVAEGESPQLLPSIPLELSADVAISLVNTVKRTLEPLVLADARLNSQFAADSYIQRHQPKSILCIPIINQGQLIGVLYLENNLTVGAFTSDRIEVLNLICAQAAISLENARLYQAAQQALTDLQQAQLTIVQSEKMSALGNLVAGVAHEINNPVGFLSGNIKPALDYINDLFRLLNLVQEKHPQLHPDVQAEIENIDLDYIQKDLPKLVSSMREGVKRIKDISTSLRTFSRADTNHPVACNIHDGIDSTIIILKHRLKVNEVRPEIKVIKEYGDLPKIECYAGQLNQVFMNLLSNAIDAVEDSNQGRKYTEIANEITIKTELSEDKNQAIIRIKDNGIGMSAEVQTKIFEHLFTTKGVGKGTGLGLAIARQIIEEKHGGKIEVNSRLDNGTEFIILLPIKEQI